MKLQNMSAAAFDEYLPMAIQDYAKDKVEAGTWSKEEAIRLSEQSFQQLLPQREKTPSHHLFSVVVEDEVVGMIWLHQATKEEGFIYDFFIYDPNKGKGYGKKTMILLEDEAKRLNITKIGLHVFGQNKIAIELYQKLGYATTDITMAKEL